MTYQVLVERTAEKDLRLCPKNIRNRLIPALRALQDNPCPAGAKKLVGSVQDWRIRIGDYRILYEVKKYHRYLSHKTPQRRLQIVLLRLCTLTPSPAVFAF